MLRDIRSVHADVERIESFGERAEIFFKKFHANTGPCCMNAMRYPLF